MSSDPKQAHVGILLTNLGTPDSPQPKAVRRYLKEFLSDPLVVDTPRWLWWPILYGIILPFRPSKASKAYQKIWTQAGSPLRVISELQTEVLQHTLTDATPVALAMRYGKPSIAAGLEKLQQAGVDKIIVLPLYPQFSHTTTTSTFDAVNRILQTGSTAPELSLIQDYHDHPAYISALANSVRKHWQQHSQPDTLLMSFHGIPQRYCDEGDPYHTQCQHTASLLAEALNLTDKQWQISFQSRVGREPWLQPYTFQHLQHLAQQGNHSIHVICPGFSADCLETLEEIAIENRDVFLTAGGQYFSYIPCLNAQADHIALFKQLIAENL